MCRIFFYIQKKIKIFWKNFLSNCVERFFLQIKAKQCIISKQWIIKEKIRRWKRIKSIQKWISIEKILDKGIIKLKKNKYIKILRVIPINYNLKTQLEKESILNSYKVFLKTCNFDIQILIQSKKEDLSNHMENIQKISQITKNNILKKYSEEYIKFIKEKNDRNKSASKNIYLIIMNNSENLEENIIQDLNEKYFKIKDCLSRCGNIVLECKKEETKNILFSFFNLKKFLE